MLTIITSDAQWARVSSGVIWTVIGIAIAITLAFYALRSIGLYVMAKKREVKHAFIAFIPLVWIYVACKLVGKINFIGSTFEKLAILLTVIFAFASVVNLFYQFIIYFPVAGNFLVGNDLYMLMAVDEKTVNSLTGESGPLQIIWGNFAIFGDKSTFVDPYAKMGIYAETLNPLLTALSYTGMILDLAVMIITIMLYINLFKKYYPQHFILFAVLSWMGIFAPLVFAVRNKAPVNYNDYIRERYNAWYAGGNPYGAPYQNRPPETPPTPFSEFAEKDEIDPGDPFENLSNNSSGSQNDKDKDEFFD